MSHLDAYCGWPARLASPLLVLQALEDKAQAPLQDKALVPLKDKTHLAKGFSGTSVALALWD